MDWRGARSVARILGLRRSRRWVARAAALLATAWAARGAAAAHPAGHQAQEAGPTYGARDVSVVEEDGALVIRIAGKPVDLVARVEAAPVAGGIPEPPGIPLDGIGELPTPAPEPAVIAYRSSIFPFRTFASLDDISRALVETEGELWLLDS
jgi:hypothetical protein